MRRLYHFLPVIICLLAPLASADGTIVIIRHGEKPPGGIGQLSCQGLNRALALAPLLLSRYGVPVALYAPNPLEKKIDHGQRYAYIRPLATLEPLAIRVGLPVNLDWGMSKIEPLAKHLLARTAGTYVVAWEHHWAEALARVLMKKSGGDERVVPTWEDADFDSLFVIRISTDSNGRRQAAFRHEHQALDNLPEACIDGPLPGPR